MLNQRKWVYIWCQMLHKQLTSEQVLLFLHVFFVDSNCCIWLLIALHKHPKCLFIFQLHDMVPIWYGDEYVYSRKKIKIILHKWTNYNIKASCLNIWCPYVLVHCMVYWNEEEKTMSTVQNHWAKSIQCWPFVRVHKYYEPISVLSLDDLSPSCETCTNYHFTHSTTPPISTSPPTATTMKRFISAVYLSLLA